MIFCSSLLLRRLKRLLLVEMCSNAHLLNINSASARIPASSENKISTHETPLKLRILM
jgi:hypothetical protein